MQNNLFKTLFVMSIELKGSLSVSAGEEKQKQAQLG